MNKILYTLILCQVLLARTSFSQENLEAKKIVNDSILIQTEADILFLQDSFLSLKSEQDRLKNLLMQVGQNMSSLEREIKSKQKLVEEEKKKSVSLEMAIKEKDYIINLDGDTILGTIYTNLNSNIYESHNQVSFLSAEGTEASIIYPDEIQGYFKGPNDHYRAAFVGAGQGKKFIKLLVPGYAKLYIYNYRLSGGGNQTDLFIGKEKYSVKKLKEIGFAKNYYKYFYDCPEIRDKIYKKELKYENIKVIVRDYNECARANQSSNGKN